MSRTRQDIEKEYQQMCMTLGDRNYRIQVLKAEVDELVRKLAELNKEASALEAEAPKAEEASSESAS